MGVIRFVCIPVLALAGLAGAVAPSGAPAAAGAVDTARVAPLGWMAGCWRRTTPQSTIEEQWMTPAGGALLGIARTLRRSPDGERMVAWEFLRIMEQDSAVVLAALPSGQQPAEFRALEISDTAAVFENLAHDFPQRVLYRRRGADSLLGRIEGVANGAARAVDFPYARVACADAR